MINEPPYTRSAWAMVNEAKGFGGLKGEAQRLQALRTFTRFVEL